MSAPIEKVREAVERSGFPLELKVARSLSALNYHVATNLYYIDNDEGKGRELDIRALKNWTWKAGVVDSWARHCLLVQCKRSLSPWVVLTSAQNTYDPDPALPPVGGLKHPLRLLEAIGESLLNATHPLRPATRLGRTYFEARFAQKPDSKRPPRDPIFEALISVVKATIAIRESGFAAGSYDACFYYPVVVLDGELWESYLDDRGEIAVRETDVISVAFSYASPSYETTDMAVTILRYSALDGFLKRMDVLLELLAAVMQRTPTLFEKPIKSP